MDRALDRMARKLTRAWVERYTLGLPASVRDLRRKVIESDLFEHCADAQRDDDPHRFVAGELLHRLILGIPNDLGWRLEILRSLPNGANQWRISIMNISARTMRWIAACALLAGATMIGARLIQILSGSEGSPAGAIALPVAILAITGVLGLYAQNRDTNKCSAVGLVLMLLGDGPA